MNGDPIPSSQPAGEPPGERAALLAGSNLAKADRLRHAGVEPYPYAYERTHSIEELRADFAHLMESAATISIASRVAAFRSAGKRLFFLDLAPTAGAMRQGNKIQVMVRRDEVDASSVLVIENLAIGDWVGVEGTCMLTRSQEPTVLARRVSMLSKVLRTVPFPKIQAASDGAATEHYRIQDPETLWRSPELDMLTGRKAEVLAARSRVLRRLRNVLADEFGCIEVETPYLNACFGGADARPFTTQVAALDQQVFLSISPEIELKRAVVGGLGSGGKLGEGVFCIARNFRNEGVDRTHNPEFTALEVYVPFVDYTFMMHLTEVLFREACIAVHGCPQCTFRGQTLDFGAPWPRLPMVELVSANSGIDVGRCTAADIRASVRERGLDAGGEIAGALAASSGQPGADDLLAILERAGVARLYPRLDGASAADLRALAERHRLPLGVDTTLDWDHLVLKLFDMFCEPLLWQPCHVTLHPAKSTILCKRARGAPLPNEQALIERFESFGAAMELTNAYSELNDPVLQRALIMEQAQQRAAGKADAMPHNERFVQSIELGLPPCGGLGIGIDRMMMLILDCQSIREVIAFPMTGDDPAGDP